jgi:hypothetical protein
MTMQRRRGGVLQIVIAAGLALGGLIWAGVAGAPSWTTTNARKPLRRPDPPATRIEVEVALERIGLTLKSVAAAGLNSAQVSAVVGEAATSIRGNIQSLRNADTAAGNARAEVDRLGRLIQAGVSTEQDRAAYAAAQNNLSTAQAQAQTVLNAASTAAMANFSPELHAALDTLNANKAWDLPVQYRAVSRSQADWVNLRDALANQRIAAAWNEDPDPAAAALLQTVNTDPAVNNAANNLASTQELQTAWNQAVGP